MTEGKPFRVLSLDGGGMRGSYTATYLSCLANAFASRRRVPELDVGAGFDLIVGTSTGAIIACALAAGIPLLNIVELYRKFGASIFSLTLPQRVGPGLFLDLLRRRTALAAGNEALRAALAEQFHDITLSDLYNRRKIALAITAVELTQHRSWVFKTPHLPTTTSHRDDNYRLVDVCLASTAAPIYRSLAVVEHADGGSPGYRIFADGGLWANNPVLVGLIDALEMAEHGREIQIFCLGTCPRPAGEQISKDAVHRNLADWKFGGSAASLSIDAQEFAYDNIAKMLAKHLDHSCTVVRFPQGQIPGALMPYLDLDNTDSEAIDALINQARSDADMANSRCSDRKSLKGQLIARLFDDLPVCDEAAEN